MSAQTKHSSLIDKQKIEFHNYLVDFIEYMQNTPCLDKKYQREFKKYGRYYVSLDRMEFIVQFVNQMSAYASEISVQYDGMFSDDDPKFSGQPITIFYGIDFKDMWKSCYQLMTPEFRSKFWKDLKTLFVFSNYVVKSHTEFNSIVKKHQSVIAKMIQSLNESQKIKDEAQRQIELEKLEEESNRIDFKSLFDIFGEDNHITSIIVEIAKELDLAKTFSSGLGAAAGANPLKAFADLFGPDQTKLTSIMEKIGDKIKDKMVSRGITQDQLFEDAKKLQERLVSKFKGITGIPGLEDIGVKLMEYLKDMNISGPVSGEGDGDGDGNGNGYGNGNQETHISMEDLQQEMRKFQEHIAQFDPSGEIDISKLIGLNTDTDTN
jgi:hypothetical protein